MKVGRLVTSEGVEYTLAESQLGDIIGYLQGREGNDAVISKSSGQAAAADQVDPEDYERAVQAAYFTSRKNAVPAAA
jgi:hypothetical protein